MEWRVITWVVVDYEVIPMVTNGHRLKGQLHLNAVVHRQDAILWGHWESSGKPKAQQKSYWNSTNLCIKFCFTVTLPNLEISTGFLIMRT